MRKFLAIATILSGLALAGQALAAPVTAADCADTARIDAIYRQGIAALDRNELKAANDLISPWIKACPNLPLTPTRAVAAAVAAQRHDDPEGVIGFLEQLPPGKVPFGSRIDWMRMLAYRELGDQSHFAAQRAKLLADADRALSDPARGRRVETFEVGDYHVSAYAARVNQDPFVRTVEFIIHTDSPLELPTSILIGRDRGADAVARDGPKPVFVDHYSCAAHAALAIVPEPFSYDQAKARVTAFLGGEDAAASRQREAVVEPVCAWPQYITPGLDPAPAG